MNSIDIEFRLRQLGANIYDIKLPETKALENILQPDEDIDGIIYGRYQHTGEDRVGRGALVVTTKRVLLVDKKPMVSKLNEISFRVVSGVSYVQAGPAGTVVLSTRVGDIHVRTLNKKCVDHFVLAVDQIMSNNNGDQL